jgi:trypsin-like peptidase
MSSDAPGIARFFRGESVVGGGALLPGGRVLTCAHVVDAALGRRDDTAQRPDQTLMVDFPLQGIGREAARVVAWCPRGDLGKGDVAIVELASGPMPAVAPLELIGRRLQPDEALRLFGFPPGRRAGVWKGDLSFAGPMVGRWMQLKARGTHDYKLQEGFSGCPVIDVAGDIVGIFAQAEKAQDVDMGAFIPVAVAAEAVRQSDGIDLPISSQASLLRNYFIDPTPVFRRLDLESFTGRGWLLEDLRAYLGDELLRSGTWFLTAEAGLGKSAFMAHLVQESGYPHVFMEQARGPAGTALAIQSLAVQLIMRYRIPPYYGQDSLPEALTASPDFLSRMLEETARLLPPGERLPILIDALDEADYHVGGNVLGLPRQLPDGIFVVASSRPVGFRMFVEPLRRLEISGTENRDDIHAYLQSIVRKAWLAERLDAAGIPGADFVQAVEARCQDNWMYLHYLFNDLEREPRHGPLDLERLPVGLAAYYAQFWSEWREFPAWTDTYRPLLATLGASAEPLTVETLTRWSETTISAEDVRRLLREKWAAFVQQPDPGSRLFQPYHATLRDYLRGDLRIRYPTTLEESLAEELKDASVQAHKRIVSETKAECGGNLPALGDGYGRKHVSFHLREAGDLAGLQSLIESPEWFQSQDRFSPDGAYFFADLSEAQRSARAWAAGGSPADTAALRQDVWCALAAASIRDGCSNVPERLVPQLVRARIWTPQQALTAVRTIPDVSARTDRLLELLDVLEGDFHALAELDIADTLLKLPDRGPDHRDPLSVWEQALRRLPSAAWERALAGLSSDMDEASGADFLALLVSIAGPEMAVTALERAGDFEFDYSKVLVLSAVAKSCAASAVTPLLGLVRSLVEDSALSAGICALAQETAFEPIAELAREAERIASDDDFADAFVALTPRLTPELCERLHAARAGTEPSPGSVRVLVALSGHRDGALREAARLARELEPGESRARGLVEAALGRAERPHRALAEIERLADEDQVANLLDRLAPALELAENLKHALRLAMRLEAYKRERVLRALRPKLTDDLRAEAIRELMRPGGPDDEPTLRAIVALAPDPALPEVLQKLPSVPPYQRGEPLAKLIERLPDALLPAALPALRGLMTGEAIDSDYALSAIAPRLAGDQAHELLVMLRDELGDLWHSDWTAMRNLSLIAARLDRADHDLAIETAARLKTPQAKVHCLLELRALGLAGDRDVLALAVDAARSASAKEGQAACLSEVAQHVDSAEERDRLLAKALAAARVLGDEADAFQNAFSLLGFDPVLFGSRLLEVARRIDDQQRRKDWLTAGVKYAEGKDAMTVFDYMFRVASAPETSESDAFDLLIPLLEARPREVRARAYSELATFVARTSRITVKQIASLFDAAADLDREPPIADILRLIPTAIKAFHKQSERSAVWRSLGRAGGSQLRKLAFDHLNTEFHASDTLEERAALGVSLLELDPRIPDRHDVIAVSFRGAAEAFEWGFLGPSRDDLLRSLSSLLSGSEARWVLDHLGELRYGGQQAAALAAIAPIVAGEDLDRAVQQAMGLARWPQVYGKAVTPLVARLCELREWLRARELADTVEHPDWQIRPALELLLAHSSAQPAELIEALRKVVAVAARRLTQIGPGSRSWTLNDAWKADAAQRILKALAGAQSELERAVEIISDGGLLQACSETIIALAAETRAGTHLPGLLWRLTLDAPADRRTSLVARLPGLLETGRLLYPELKAQDLGDTVLDILRRWP